MSLPFPPTSPEHIASYDTEEVVAGYREHRPGDPAPGPNRDPGYRWGWTNARRDISHEDDGLESLRRAYIRWERARQ